VTFLGRVKTYSDPSYIFSGVKTSPPPGSTPMIVYRHRGGFDFACTGLYVCRITQKMLPTNFDEIFMVD